MCKGTRRCAGARAAKGRERPQYQRGKSVRGAARARCVCTYVNTSYIAARGTCTQVNIYVLKRMLRCGKEKGRAREILTRRFPSFRDHNFDLLSQTYLKSNYAPKITC